MCCAPLSLPQSFKDSGTNSQLHQLVKKPLSMDTFTPTTRFPACSKIQHYSNNCFLFSAAVLFALTNTVGTISGLIGPALVGVLTEKHVRYFPYVFLLKLFFLMSTSYCNTKKPSISYRGENMHSFNVSFIITYSTFNII